MTFNHLRENLCQLDTLLSELICNDVVSVTHCYNIITTITVWPKWILEWNTCHG